MADKRLDLTSGSMVKGILRFSWPLVLGNLFQQMYNIVDAVIIGQRCGVEALAAVSCTSWVCWMVNALCRDSGNTFGIMGSIRIGRREDEAFRQIAAHAVLYGLIVSAVVTALSVAALDAIVTALHIPDNIKEDARVYLLIYLLSIPPMMAFNLVSSLLRAMGNSSVTMTAMTASMAANIFLDLLFVVGFGWGIRGAALATLLSIVLSAGIGFAACFQSSLFRLRRKHFSPNRELLREGTSLLLPMLLNSAIISVGGMVVLSRSNMLGASFTAGRSAEGKIFSLLEAVIMALQMGVSVFVGQNLGAKKIDRILQGLHQSIAVIMGIFLLMAAGVLVFLEPILNLFLSKQDLVSYEEAFRVGQEAAKSVLAGMIFMTPMYIYRATIQTLGHAEFSTFAGIGQIFARIFTIFVGPSLIGIYAYYITDCVAWAVSLPIVSLPCYSVLGKLKKEMERDGHSASDS